MTDTNTSGINCNQFRELFDSQVDGNRNLEPSTEKMYKQHEESCKACHTWKSQTVEIIGMSANLPMFDVSEALTQRILASVETEKAKVISFQGLPAGPLCAATALAVVLLLPEGLQGTLSWAAGLIGLALLQLLLNSASASESVG